MKLITEQEFEIRHKESFKYMTDVYPLVVAALKFYGASIKCQLEFNDPDEWRAACAIARHSVKSDADNFLADLFNVSRATAHDATNLITSRNFPNIEVDDLTPYQECKFYQEYQRQIAKRSPKE